MMKSSVGAHASAAGLFVVLCSCLVMGCEDHDGYYYGYRHGPSYRSRSWAGAIRFEWSVSGSDAGANDEDAGVLDGADAGFEAGAGTVTQSDCDALGATEFQALLLDQGTIVGALQSRCDAGSDSLRVYANDYTVTAALVTQDGVPVTETEVIPSFVVAPGETQVVRIAFKKLAAVP
jgi:hypothetical protein